MAEARTWRISFQLSVADFGQVSLEERLVIPDTGGTRLGSEIPGFSATHNDQTQTFSVRIDVLIPSPLDDECSVDVLITGSAPTSITSQGLKASGSIQSTSFTHCTIGGSSFTQTLLITGSFAAQAEGAVLGTAAVTGQVAIITPQGTAFSSSSFTAAPGMEIRTGANDSVEITLADHSKIRIGPNSSFIIERDSEAKGFSGLLRRGKAFFDVLLAGRRFQVRTPIAIAGVRGTNFSVEYLEANHIGTFTVLVNSGVVDIEERDGTVTPVSAGQQRSLNALVNRVTTVLPADDSNFTLGVTNLFSWTAYPGASAYLLEAVTDPQGFTQANATTAQPSNFIITLGPSDLTELDGVVNWSVFVPVGEVPTGTVVQWRIFPLDASGQTMSGVTSSDAASFTAL
jgi:hypothetical protein